MSLRLPGDTSSDAAEPLTREALVGFFHRHAKTPENFKVGAEYEKLLVRRGSGAQLPYRGPDGVASVLDRIAERYPWSAFREGGDIVALTKDVECQGPKRSTVTLEPGGQVELATPPCQSLAAMESEVLAHRAELRAITGPDDVAVLGVGLTPFTAIEDIPMTSRVRHHIMADYLPSRGAMALYMMKATASIQVALDFSSDRDAARKFFCALALSPITTALFANSPYYKGEDTGLVSYRGRVWQHTDNERSGLLDGVVGDGDQIFESWTDFLLRVPMMFYAIRDKWEPAHGATFQAFMDKGHKGEQPTMADWEIHLTSVFPEVRLKQFVEVRGADAVGHRLGMSFPALWKGIFYDEGALNDALALARELEGGSRPALFDEAITRGLRGTFAGRSLKDWAEEMLKIASRGLKAQGARFDYGDESRFLDPAFEIVASGMSPGDHLRRLVKGAKRPDPAQLIDAMAF